MMLKVVGQSDRRENTKTGDDACSETFLLYISLAQPQPQRRISTSSTMAEAPSPAPVQLREQRIEKQKKENRIGLPYGLRLPAASGIAFVVGMGLGVAHGSEVTALRFRAENAHRLPTTPTGWYLYHKSKNYQAAFGGLKEGVRMSAKVSFWTASFFGIEEMFDRYRRTKDFFNTVIASCSVAGAFSVLSELLCSLSCCTGSSPSQCHCCFWQLCPL